MWRGQKTTDLQTAVEESALRRLEGLGWGSMAERNSISRGLLHQTHPGFRETGVELCQSGTPVSTTESSEATASLNVETEASEVKCPQKT